MPKISRIPETRYIVVVDEEANPAISAAVSACFRDRIPLEDGLVKRLGMNPIVTSEEIREILEKSGKSCDNLLERVKEFAERCKGHVYEVVKKGYKIENNIIK